MAEVTRGVNSLEHLAFGSIAEIHPRLEAREVSPIELVAAVLDRIERHDTDLRAYITVVGDAALEQARVAEAEIAAGRYRGPLHGIPVALKDNIATRGVRTSCASSINPDWVPSADAAVYRRLREAGAVLVGKANLHEYAFSMSPDFPPPLNPWNAAVSSSGSSSGSAVAVAAGMAHGAIGSDTGGSGRGPANANGVVGLKPTYGRVSCAGLFPLSLSLDHISTMSRRVRDAGLMLDAISGFDATDPNSAAVEAPDPLATIGRDIRGLRVGRARGYTIEDVDSEVTSTIDRGLAVLEELGATISDVDVPYVRHGYALQTSIMLPEAAEVHERSLRDVPELFGETAIMRLDLGSVIPATSYVRAKRIVNDLRAAFETMFLAHDVVVGPVSPVRTGPAGSWTACAGGETIDVREVGPEYTGIYNLAGNPAIAVPAGFGSDGTPIGLQIAGKWWDEATVIQVADAFEAATNWHTMHPPAPGRRNMTSSE